MTSWRHIIRRALVSGSNASVFSTAALMVGGHRDCASVFAPVNAVSHWLWADRAIRQDRPSLRYTLTGYGIHHAMSILWAITYETLVDRRRRRADPGAADSAPAEGKHAADPAMALPYRGSRTAANDEPASTGEPGTSGDPGTAGTPDDSGKVATSGGLERLHVVDVPVLPVLAIASVVAAGACLVDLRCTPARLTPGFERRLGPSSLLLVYAAFGVGLAVCDGVMAGRRR